MILDGECGMKQSNSFYDQTPQKDIRPKQVSQFQTIMCIKIQ